ncbi:hypothetical protein BJX61DRAFT_409870 [Aspergillus egyptiacus]|nr:hypothetical protein BJX61DRAFT_409870 [Aspergillus egyptiacus]
MDLELLASTPVMSPPDGQASDFDAPYNSLQIGTMVAFGVTYGIASVFLGLRYFQAFKLIQKVELDLMIVTVSYGVALYYFISMVQLMDHGWGKHAWNVNMAQLMEYQKALLPNTLSYLVCPAITKLSILAVVYRINPAALYRIAVMAVAAMIFGYTLTLCIITGSPCNPLKPDSLQCLENVALSGAILNIASDFAVLALPIPTIHGLQLSLRQKLSVACLLAVGSGVIVCSIARLPYVIQMSKTTDSTWTQAILGVWSTVELNLGIICACAMRFKHLIVRYFPGLSLFSGSGSRSRKAGGTTGTGTGTFNAGASANRFHADAGHNYQLHSVQRGNADPYSTDDYDNDGAVKTREREIAVAHSFKVEVHTTEREERGYGYRYGDQGSEERILG